LKKQAREIDAIKASVDGILDYDDEKTKERAE
jgi:hypothetical protein